MFISYVTFMFKCMFFFFLPQSYYHAVGGWNAQASAAQDGLSSLRQFYKMLRRNGFPKANIKTFFEDGFDVSQSELLSLSISRGP